MTFNRAGWMRAELTITALLVFAGLHLIDFLAGWIVKPIWLFPITLLVILVISASGELVERLRRK